MSKIDSLSFFPVTYNGMDDRRLRTQLKFVDIVGSGLPTDTQATAFDFFIKASFI
jgi:hypothetical protein